MVKQDHLHHDPEPQKASPCPFGKCAGKPTKLGILNRGSDWWVYCKNCHCSGPVAHGELEAVQLWNDRNLSTTHVTPKPSRDDSGHASLGKVMAFLIVAFITAVVWAKSVEARLIGGGR